MFLLQKDKPQKSTNSYKMNPIPNWMPVWLMGVTVLEVTSVPLPLYSLNFLALALRLLLQSEFCIILMVMFMWMTYLID